MGIKKLPTETSAVNDACKEKLLLLIALHQYYNIDDSYTVIHCITRKIAYGGNFPSAFFPFGPNHRYPYTSMALLIKNAPLSPSIFNWHKNIYRFFVILTVIITCIGTSVKQIYCSGTPVSKNGMGFT